MFRPIYNHGKHKCVKTRKIFLLFNLRQSRNIIHYNVYYFWHSRYISIIKIITCVIYYRHVDADLSKMALFETISIVCEFQCRIFQFSAKTLNFCTQTIQYLYFFFCDLKLHTPFTHRFVGVNYYPYKFHNITL